MVNKGLLWSLFYLWIREFDVCKEGIEEEQNGS
jgi:hypothetical protein